MLILLFFSALFFISHLSITRMNTHNRIAGRRFSSAISDMYFHLRSSSAFILRIAAAAERPFRILSSSVRAPPLATSFFSPFHGPPLLLFLSVTSRVTSFLCETLFVSRCTCSTRTMPVCTVKKHDRRERERKGQRERKSEREKESGV